MEARAVNRYARISPQKIRLLMDEVRGKQVEEALSSLKFAPQKGARTLYKLIESATANASQEVGVDVDALYVKRIHADGGPILKRWRPRAQGRATRIRKRTSHLTVVLADG